MTSTLHEAIAAVRAGDMERAQLVAADIVQHNPDDANAWYLLSQLVDSDARRAAYLSKTLALAPNHPRARAEFAALPPELTGDLNVPQAEYEATAAAVDELFREEAEVIAGATLEEAVVVDMADVEMADVETAGIAMVDVEGYEAAVEAAPVEIPTAEPVPATVATATAPGAEVPEWLQPLGPQPAAPATASRPQAAAPTPRPRRPAPARKSSANQALSIMLGLLTFLTLLVLGFLIYLLFF